MLPSSRLQGAMGGTGRSEATRRVYPIGADVAEQHWQRLHIHRSMRMDTFPGGGTCMQRTPLSAAPVQADLVQDGEHGHVGLARAGGGAHQHVLRAGRGWGDVVRGWVSSSEAADRPPVWQEEASAAVFHLSAMPPSRQCLQTAHGSMPACSPMPHHNHGWTTAASRTSEE